MQKKRFDCLFWTTLNKKWKVEPIAVLFLKFLENLLAYSAAYVALLIGCFKRVMICTVHIQKQQCLCVATKIDLLAPLIL